MQLWIGVAVSAGVHLGFGALVLAEREAPAPRRLPSTVSIEVSEPERAPEPPPTPKPEPAEPTQAARRASLPAPPTPAPAPTPESSPPAPEPEGPLDLGGLTLTNDGTGPGWSAPSRGSPRERAPLARPTASARAPAASKPPAPALVAAADLSRRPAPPALDAALAANYPPDLRRRGIGGVAVVRIVVGSDGRVRTSSVVSESEPGFGAACERTVLGSRWVAPLDKSGRPVGTRVSYTCRFVVDGR